MGPMDHHMGRAVRSWLGRGTQAALSSHPVISAGFLGRTDWKGRTGVLHVFFIDLLFHPNPGPSLASGMD